LLLLLLLRSWLQQVPHLLLECSHAGSAEGHLLAAGRLQ
jgi:hypothetical protein